MVLSNSPHSDLSTFPFNWNCPFRVLLSSTRPLSILKAEMIGDKIYPLYCDSFPIRLRGILIAAILAAVMSSIDSSLNSVSTITLLDFYYKYFGQVDEARQIKRNI